MNTFSPLDMRSLASSGSSISVYGTIPASSGGSLDFTADYIFFLDGQPVGNFSRAGSDRSEVAQPGQSSIQVLYFSTSTFGGQHVFVLQNGRDGGGPSTILFDYLTYSM